MNKFLSALVSIDQRIVLQLVPQRKLRLNRWIRFISKLGDGWIWILLGGAIFLLDSNGGIVLLQMAMAIGTELLIYKIVKEMCSRKRPFDLLKSVTCIINPYDRYSFPSGHTATAFAVVATAGLHYDLLFMPLLLLAFLIGFSRVYAGVHYPSDVVAGALLGVTCAECARLLL
jgi:undecaprenyl-diphosphatase